MICSQEQNDHSTPRYFYLPCHMAASRSPLYLHRFHRSPPYHLSVSWWPDIFLLLREASIFPLPSPMSLSSTSFYSASFRPLFNHAEAYNPLFFLQFSLLPPHSESFLRNFSEASSVLAIPLFMIFTLFLLISISNSSVLSSEDFQFE